MALGIIELNDAGIRVGKGEVGEGDYSESPGVALIGKKHLLLGEEAMRQSRLQPVETNSLFWQRLSDEPLPLPNSQFRHHADLAYSHLLHLHQTIPDCDEVIFALPGSFTRAQMSMLLGIVGQCPFDAVGLVDSAVAAGVSQARAGTSIHVDLQLHQCVFTQMRADGELSRSRVEILRNCGLFSLQDRWAKIIADEFIDQARFDPLHSATSEQSLYDQLPECLRQCEAKGEFFLEIAGKGIKLTRQQLVLAVEPIYQQMIDKAALLIDESGQAQGQVLVSDRLAALPGLLSAFSGKFGEAAESLPPDAVLRGIQNNIPAVKTGTEQLKFIQALPSRVPPASRTTETLPPEPPARESAALKKRATHLLIDDTAHALGDANLYVDLKTARVAREADGLKAQCWIRQQGKGVSLVPINGAAIKVNPGTESERLVSDNCLLHCGDSLSIDENNSRPITLIEVLDVNGS